MTEGRVESAMAKPASRAAERFIDATVRIVAGQIRKNCKDLGRNDEDVNAVDIQAENLTLDSEWVPGRGFAVELPDNWTRSGDPHRFTASPAEVADKMKKRKGTLTMTDRRPGKGAAPAAPEKPTKKNPGQTVFNYVFTTLIGAFGVLSIGGYFAGFEELKGPAILFGWIFSGVALLCLLAFYNDDHGSRWAATVGRFGLTTIAIGTIWIVGAVVFGVDILAWAD